MSRKIGTLIRLFSQKMRDRMEEKEAEGWEGWDDREIMNDAGKNMGTLKERIIGNALQGDWVDVANLAMIAWNLEESE